MHLLCYACTAVGVRVKAGRDYRPVMTVNWEDVKQYVAWLSKTTGRPYRLLTDAEGPGFRDRLRPAAARTGWRQLAALVLPEIADGLAAAWL